MDCGLSFRTTGSFLWLCLAACHGVMESGFSFAHPKSLITSKGFVTVVFVCLSQREMNPFNLCCLYYCLYRVQLPTERFLGHAGFSTKQPHTENLRPHSMRQKGAFASVWVNYLIVGWVGRMIMDKEWGWSTMSRVTFQGVGGVLLSPPEASELMPCWSYMNHAKALGEKEALGFNTFNYGRIHASWVEHVPLREDLDKNQVLRTSVRASQPLGELLLGAQ